MERSPIKVADFFCGCGGFGQGFHKEQFQIVLANDIWSDALESHQLNFPETPHVLGDISKEQIKGF